MDNYNKIKHGFLSMIEFATDMFRQSCPSSYKKVQVGKDQEKAQSEKNFHSNNRDGKKTKLTIRYLYHENIS